MSPNIKTQRVECRTRKTPRPMSIFRRLCVRLIFRLVTMLFVVGALPLGHSKAVGAESDRFDPFLAYVDPERSRGAIAVKRRHDTKAPPWVTVYSWEFGQFLAETGFSDSHSLLTLTNVAFSAGRWNGTNWGYRNGDLVVITRISKGSDLAELMRALGGKMPEEAAFQTILGRGLDLRDFGRLQVRGNTIRGIYHQHIPFSGVIEREPDRLEYTYGYTLDGTETIRIHHLTLQPFPGGGFLPAHLTIWVVDGGITNVERDFEVIAVSAIPARPSLSPFQLYSEARLLEQADDRLFLILDGVKHELKRNPRVTRNPDEVSHRSKLVFIALFGGVTLLVVFIGFLLRSRRPREMAHNKQPSNADIL
jgi:hypothetical protein